MAVLSNIPEPEARRVDGQQKTNEPKKGREESEKDNEKPNVSSIEHQIKIGNR